MISTVMYIQCNYNYDIAELGILYTSCSAVDLASISAKEPSMEILVGLFMWVYCVG